MADRHEMTLVVSIVVGPGNRLLYGTVIDVEEGAQSRHGDRIGVLDAVGDWLSRRTSAAPRDPGSAAPTTDADQ